MKAVPIVKLNYLVYKKTGPSDEKKDFYNGDSLHCKIIFFIN